MKLGTQTGSLTNHILSRAVVGQPEPTVGMGATILCWTDRHAATIVQIFTRNGVLYLIAKEDHAKRIDKNGMSECQEYSYTPNHDGSEHTFRREQDGRWQSVHFNAKTKRYSKCEGNGLRIGERNEYHDFSF